MSAGKDKETGTGRTDSARSFFKGFKGLERLREDLIIKEVYSAGGPQVYLVGGVLRNLALSVPAVPDYDFVVKGDPRELSEKMAARLSGASFILDKETSAYRVVAGGTENGYTLDLSPMKGQEIVFDLLKRDFTVNAMAVDLSALFGKGEPFLIDPCNGVADAEARLLRTVSDGVFADDPLRMLRALRLSRQYGLTVSDDTRTLVKENAGLISGVSAERTREELVLLFLCRGAAGGISSLYATGLAGVIFPEIVNWADVDGYDLLTHSLKTLEEAERLLDGISGQSFPAVWERLKELFNGSTGSVPNRAFFKLVAFFHDFGKPYAISREGGRLRFIGHDSKGAEAVKEVFTRLKFSGKAAREAASLVKNHHRAFMLASLENPTDRTRAHFFRAAGGEPGILLLCLALADARATRGGEDPELYKLCLEMMRFYYDVYLRKKPRPLLSGAEIMEIFKVEEGPIVGGIIQEMNRGVESGAVKTRKDAVRHIKKWLSDKKN